MWTQRVTSFHVEPEKTSADEYVELLLFVLAEFRFVCCEEERFVAVGNQIIHEAFS